MLALRDVTPKRRARASLTMLIPPDGSTTKPYSHVRWQTTSAVDHPFSKITRGREGYKGLRRCGCDAEGVYGLTRPPVPGAPRVDQL
jgi:hypothetical protein